MRMLITMSVFGVAVLVGCAAAKAPRMFAMAGLTQSVKTVNVCTSGTPPDHCNAWVTVPAP
jgi:hypothetical protein